MQTEPIMARGTDPQESWLHNASVPKVARSRQILERLLVGGAATYVTLCDFGQVGGPAANRTLLTALERDGYVVKVGRLGRAGLFDITLKGRVALRD